MASISEVAAPTPYPIYYGAERAAALTEDAATPVQPCTNEVVVTVSVTYRIK